MCSKRLALYKGIMPDNKYFIVVSCGTEGTPRLQTRKQAWDYFVHHDLASAYAEATRLSIQHEGVKFGVFEWLGMVVNEQEKVIDIPIKIKVP